MYCQLPEAYKKARAKPDADKRVAFLDSLKKMYCPDEASLCDQCPLQPMEKENEKL